LPERTAETVATWQCDFTGTRSLVAKWSHAQGQENLSRKAPTLESDEGICRGLGAMEGSGVVGCTARVDLHVVPSTVSCRKEKFL